MKARVRQAQATRWLYRIESEALSTNRKANVERPMAALRKLAERAWRAEAPAGRKFPTIKAGRGTPHCGTLASYCLGYSDIVLARHQRTLLVVLHELTHALGPSQHGERFVRRYFSLLRKHAGYTHECLQGIAAERNIVLE